MADVFNPEKRSEIMSHVRNKSTAPEIQLRSLLHRAGYRFRIGVKELPGKPDIVLAKYKTAIFVNGCFWHGHSCQRGHRPATNVHFWNEKIEKNIKRDKKVAGELAKLGWHVLVVWQCELKSANQVALMQKIEDYLSGVYCDEKSGRGDDYGETL